MKLKYLFAWYEVGGKESDKLREAILKILAKGKKVVITVEEE